jgi:hypothetical protein
MPEPDPETAATTEPRRFLISLSARPVLERRANGSSFHDPGPDSDADEPATELGD